jgi:hypothetical protein
MKNRKARNRSDGMKQRNMNGFGSPRLDSIADKMDGTEESHSHADDCRIRPKNIIATMKPKICKQTGYSLENNKNC